MRLSSCTQIVGQLLVAATSVFSTAGARGEEATHTDAVDVVVRGKSGQTLQTFCLGADGKIFAILSQPLVYGVDQASQSSGTGEVRVMDPDGKQLSSWPVDFAPQRISAAPNGDIVIGGSGRIARYSSEGKLIKAADSPHLATVLGDQNALRNAAEEQHRGNIESYTEQIKQFEEQLKELEAAGKKRKAEKEAAEKQKGDSKKRDAEKKEAVAEKKNSLTLFGLFTVEATAGAESDESDPDGQLQMIRQMTDSYRRMLESEKKRTVEDVMREITVRLQRIHGIAVGDDDVYVATAMSKGYGYAVWRMSKNFDDAKQVVAGLSGCCGQIDVQCRGDQLFVAENSRHRVVSYDRDGNRIDAWGKRDRDGEGGGFGGCCNPMNLCFLGDGDVITSESEGLVKRFSPSGEFLGLIGKAKVGGGCKNVAVAASPDGKKVYFYDLQGSKIIILSRRESAKSDSTAAVSVDR